MNNNEVNKTEEEKEAERVNNWIDNSSVILNNTLGILSMEEKLDPMGLGFYRDRCSKVVENILNSYEEFLGMK